MSTLLSLLLPLLPLSLSAPLIATPRMVDVVHIIDEENARESTVAPSTTPAPKADWPSGDYCILSGPAGTCPEGFAHGSITLAVPVSVGLGEMYRSGSELHTYVKVGRVGGLELSMLPYEQIYSLKMSACCKIMPVTPISTGNVAGVETATEPFIRV